MFFSFFLLNHQAVIFAIEFFEVDENFFQFGEEGSCTVLN